MWGRFLSEVRGRFELNQSQAIGSIVLIFVIMFFIAVPLVYRYVLIDTVDVESVESTVVESIQNEEAIQIIPTKDKPEKNSYQKKEHRILPQIKEGEEIELKETQLVSVYPEKQLPLINLNTADTTVFKSVRGIGSFYAKRIVKYRTRLGGFVNVGQLDNVYNLPVEAKNNLIARLDSSKLVANDLIDINHVTFKKLLSRQILNYEEVKKVFQYRNKTFFYTKNDLYKTGLDSSKVNLLLPYVEVVP